MNFRSLMTAICVLATANIVSAAPFAYIANSGTKNVSVIDTATNTVTATVTLPDDNGATKPDPYAYGVAVGASGQYVYVGLQDTNEVTVIDAATNTVVKRIALGTDSPGGLAVNAAETRLYVASNKSNTLIVIDITGANASEVARVTVDDSALSSPEGVVLSADGLKAYVANSIKGTIAEISLDEAGNIYTRTNLIALGGNSQPMGLTLNSTGTKLYAAGLSGTASVVDTATRVATDLTVGGGNVSVAINNVANPKQIYAPSVSLDKIYVIDGTANTVSGTTYPAIGAPKGSAVTPDGSKLLLTMNASTSGETVQVFNTGNLSAAPAVINLPAGALPNSMGNFIGPAFPYTITSSDDTLCSIVPEGSIPVNSYGRSFTVSQTPSVTCDVTVDGSSVGSPSVYPFTAVTAGHTINATKLPSGTYYTLSGDWITSIGGCLQSDVLKPGISCLSKSAKYIAGSQVTLTPTNQIPATLTQVRAGTWTGSCVGSGVSCTLTMDGDKTFGAELILASPGGKVKNETKGTYHATVAEATAAATTGDVIKISTDIASATTTGTVGVTVKMSSQWKSSDYTLDPVYRALALTITDVAVIADNLTL